MNALMDVPFPNGSFSLFLFILFRDPIPVTLSK